MVACFFGIDSHFWWKLDFTNLGWSMSSSTHGLNRLRWKVQVLTFGVFGFMEFLISFLFSHATVDERICNHREWYKNMRVELPTVIIPLHDTMPKSSMSHILHGLSNVST